MSSIVNSMKEVYQYRTFLYSMVVRNLKGRYRNSALGFAWHFVTPGISILLFYIVFTGVMNNNVEHYWAYLCIGMFPFTFFQTNLSAGSGCVESNGGIIKKMYFPREIVVLAQVIGTFITLLFAYSGVIFLMAIGGIQLTTTAILFLPLILLLSLLFAIGYVLLLSALSAFVRDLKFFIEATSRVLFWITPIFYLTRDTSGILEKVIWYNPFTYFIELYHDVLYFGTAPDVLHTAVCCIFTVVFLIIGLIIFNKLKGRFAEVL